MGRFCPCAETKQQQLLEQLPLAAARSSCKMQLAAATTGKGVCVCEEGLGSRPVAALVAVCAAHSAAQSSAVRAARSHRGRGEESRDFGEEVGLRWSSTTSAVLAALLLLFSLQQKCVEEGRGENENTKKQQNTRKGNHGMENKESNNKEEEVDYLKDRKDIAR
jgi:hypothetical protein